MTEGEDGYKPSEVKLVRKDNDPAYQVTGTELYQFDFSGLEIINERDYIAIGGGWCGTFGKAATVSEALTNMIKEASTSKASFRKLELVRTIRVYECIEGTGWVGGDGSANGACLSQLPANRWTSILWDLVKPTPRKK